MESPTKISLHPSTFNSESLSPIKVPKLDPNLFNTKLIVNHEQVKPNYPQFRKGSKLKQYRLFKKIQETQNMLP